MLEEKTHTPLQTVNEIIKCSQDIEYFTNQYVKLKNTSGSDFKLYPKQGEILKSCQEHARSVVLSSRQTGLTTLMCIFTVYNSIFHHDTISAIISSKAAQASHVQSICKDIIYGLNGTPFAQSYSHTKDALRFENGSKIYNFPASSLESAIRGQSVDFIYLDNVDFHDNFGKYYYALIPAIHHNKGTLVMGGTPKYNDEQSTLRKYAKTEGFHVDTFHWSEVPSRDQKWAEEMKALLRNDEIFDAEFDIHL